MRFVRDVAYLLALFCVSPWLLASAILHGKYREGYAEKLLGRVPRRQGNRPCIWFHAVSVGEVNLLKPIIDRLGRQVPFCELVISTTTKTGLSVARSQYSDLATFYCPLDFSWAVDQAIGRLRPDMLVLAELELWPNLIASAKRSGAEVAVMNARLSQKSFRGYGRMRWLFARTLDQIDVIAAQNQTYAQRFIKIGAHPQRVSVTGSVKFDGACQDRSNAKTIELARLAGFQPDDVVFLAGSTQEPEEAYAIQAYRELASHFPRLRLVVVPRHPERFEVVASLLEQSGLSWQRRSQWGRRGLARNGRGPAPSSPRILLVDTIGELGAWWGTADVAFVGGSMGPRGGQNMIEPAAYGAAVSFGPNTRNFRDIVSALLTVDGALVVSSQDELTRFVRRCLESEGFAQSMGQRARDLVSSQTGATVKTVDLLLGCARLRQVAAAAGGKTAAA